MDTLFCTTQYRLRLFSTFPILAFFTLLLPLLAGASEASLEKSDAELNLLQTGFQLLHEKKPAKAIEAFQNVFETEGDHRMARFGWSAALFDLRQYEKALSILNQLLEEDPEDINVLNLRGLTWYHTHRFKLAIRDFKAGLKLDPNEGYFYESLAWAYLCSGQPDEASKAALRAFSIYKEMGESRSFSLLIAYLGFRTVGNQREAEKVLRFANDEMNPTDWPYPVVEYFSGLIDEDELIVEVESLLQETEARTYIAMRNYWENKSGHAQAKLGWVAQYGDPGVFEHTFAQVLLRQLAAR